MPKTHVLASSWLSKPIPSVLEVRLVRKTAADWALRHAPPSSRSRVYLVGSIIAVRRADPALWCRNCAQSENRG